jgi:hypothetical protein
MDLKKFKHEPWTPPLSNMKRPKVKLVAKLVNSNFRCHLCIIEQEPPTTIFAMVLVWISQFRMEFKKMFHLTFFVIFYLKVIICQKNDLPHICDHLKKHLPIYDMIIFKLCTCFKNLFQSYGITMFSRYYKFHK